MQTREVKEVRTILGNDDIGRMGRGKEAKKIMAWSESEKKTTIISCHKNHVRNALKEGMTNTVKCSNRTRRMRTEKRSLYLRLSVPFREMFHAVRKEV